MHTEKRCRTAFFADRTFSELPLGQIERARRQVGPQRAGEQVEKRLDAYERLAGILADFERFVAQGLISIAFTRSTERPPIRGPGIHSGPLPISKHLVPRGPRQVYSLRGPSAPPLPETIFISINLGHCLAKSRLTGVGLPPAPTRLMVK